MICRCIDGKFLIIALTDCESEKIKKISPSFFDMNFNASFFEKNAHCDLVFQIIMSAISSSNADFLIAEPPEPLIVKIIPKSAVFRQNMMVICRESTFIGEFVKGGRKNNNSNPKRRAKIHIRPKRIFYRFDNYFDAYDCISALVSHKIMPKKCTLLCCDNRFFISLQISAQSRKNTGLIMSEFGRKISFSAEKIVFERGRIVYDDFYNEVKKKSAK